MASPEFRAKKSVARPEAARFEVPSLPDSRANTTSPDVQSQHYWLDPSYVVTAAMNALSCPNCGTEIPLEEAVTYRIREELSREFQAKAMDQETAFANRELKLASREAQIEQSRLALNQEIERQVRTQADELLARGRTQAETALKLELDDLRTQLGEKNQKLAEATKAELGLRKKQREVESRQQALELEVARKIDEEREKIRYEAATAAMEDQRLRMCEKEKLISDLQAQIQVLKQKAEQGSQQLQGEVLELELESLLKEKFLSDAILPISKGVRGADLLHRVKTASGLECGTIIWETKRARNWSSAWVAKLKQDQRMEKAEIAVLLTQALPEGVRSFQFIDGVWVTDDASAIGLATALRQGLILVANSRLATDGKASKMESLYDYLIGIEFRQKIEAIVEAFVAMKTDLETEKRAFAKTWARREKQIEGVITSTALMYGSIQGIVGQSTLPEIGWLQLPGTSTGSENG